MKIVTDVPADILFKCAGEIFDTRYGMGLSPLALAKYRAAKVIEVLMKEFDFTRKGDLSKEGIKIE